MIFIRKLNEEEYYDCDLCPEGLATHVVVIATTKNPFDTKRIDVKIYADKECLHELAEKITKEVK